MKYYIDQSGKIEDTHRLTIIAMANGKVHVLRISAVEKQKLIQVMKQLEYPRKNYIYKIFSGLIFTLVTKYKKISEIVIDKEYPGHDADIKLFLLQLYEKAKIIHPEIVFDYIGKKNQAHKSALDAYRGNIKPDVIVKTEDLIRLFYPTKKGWRSRSSRDNP